MSALNEQLDLTRKALCSAKKGLTVMKLSRETKLPYHTAFKVVSMLRVAGEIEPAGYVPTGTHRAQAWKLVAPNERKV
jgi:hypothetical protein